MTTLMACCYDQWIRATFLTIGLTFILLGTTFSADPPEETKAKSKAGGSKKEPVHLVVNSAADSKQIFTYSPRPIPPTEYLFARVSGIGRYRLTIDEQGAVTQVQILKRIGVPMLDATVLKTFIRWRAKPGPVRIVDVGFTMIPGYQAIRRGEGSHIPRH
jgi:TonB family protein